jgi:MFS transporter, DHA1 family, tetracycline resistance protein
LEDRALALVVRAAQARGIIVRLLSSPLFAIFLIVAVDILGMTIMIPLLPFYAEHLGATPTQAGLLIGIYAACQLVSGPFLGRLSDSMGRKPLLLVSQAGTCAGFILTAFAGTLPILFLARAIDGSTAGNLSLAQAYISDVTKPEDRGKAFGIIGIAFGIGFLIGPAVSGLLAKYDYTYPIWAAAALSATSILTTWLLLPKVTPARAATGPGGRRLTLLQWGAYAEYFRNPRLSGRLWQFFVFCFGFSLFVGGLPLFLERRLTWGGKPFDAEHVGYVWAFAGFLGILLQGPALGRLLKRFGEHKLNVVGFGAYVAGFAILAFCTSVPVLFLSTAVSALGSFIRPALTSLITKAASREEQGAVLGLTQSLQSVAMIVAPPIGGWMIGHGLLTAWGLVAAMVMLLGFTLASTDREAPVQEAQRAAEVSS